MASSLLATVGGMGALSAAFVGILRLELGAPTPICGIVAVPAVLISSVLALYVQQALGFDLVDILVAVGVLVLVFGAAAAVKD